MWFTGTIVSIGDPKKKYTRYEKIGQGWVTFYITVLIVYVIKQAVDFQSLLSRPN